MYKSEFPKVTLFVYSYNHEKFIAQAIDGALAQTYPNLEILFSDDHSTDRTYEIMCEKVANYAGPHHIILNCNETNLGITRHLNKIVAMGTGEWFVLCAGDDISLPHRVEFIMRQVMRNPSVHAVNTGYELIDQDDRHGNRIGFAEGHLVPLGATGAWHRKVFDFFGPLQHATVGEDEIIPFRAVLLGNLLLANEPTIYYRQHTDSISNPTLSDKIEALKHLKKLHVSRIGSSSQRILDLRKAYENRYISQADYEDLLARHQQLRRELEAQIEDLDRTIGIYESNLSGKIRYLFDTRLRHKHASFLYRLRIFLLSYDWIYALNRRKEQAGSHPAKRYVSNDPILIGVSRLRNRETNLLMWQ